jgi:hypothetical protein
MWCQHTKCRLSNMVSGLLKSVGWLDESPVWC